MVVVTSKEELEDIVSSAVKKAIDIVLMQIPKKEKDESEYISRKEASERYNCSISTIDNYRRRGIIAPLKFKGGRTALISVSEIEKALKQK